MNFSEALGLIKEEIKVARAGWNGRGMFIFLEQSAQSINADKYIATFICMKDARGSFIPWLASQADLLADDWYQLGTEEEDRLNEKRKKQLEDIKIDIDARLDEFRTIALELKENLERTHS